MKSITTLFNIVMRYSDYEWVIFDSCDYKITEVNQKVDYLNHTYGEIYYVEFKAVPNFMIGKFYAN